MNKIKQAIIGVLTIGGIILTGILIKQERPPVEPEPEKLRVVGIQPYGNIENSLLDSIEAALRRAYPCEFKRLEAKQIPENARTEAKGGRVRADTIIRLMKNQLPDGVDYVVGVVDEDICIDKKGKDGKVKEPVSKYTCWGIFGLGYVPGPSCIVSTVRPKEYCKSRKQFVESMQKIAVHELGHNFGLHHCSNADKCVMRDAAETIKTIRQVGFELCENCQSILKLPH